MNILVTAGNTLVPIDKVRAITNIFTGRTGAWIGVVASLRGHAVTLLTSHPESVENVRDLAGEPGPNWTLRRYTTFDDLQARMEELIPAGGFDAIVHCAAVSDYRCAGVFAPAEGTHFDPEAEALTWSGTEGSPRLKDRAAGKVKSDENEVWLRLVRTPKLVDRIRKDWNFRGLLVKFKLEVGVSDERLLEIAKRSREQSDADLMVANTLEGAGLWAFLGPIDGLYPKISRRDLALRLVEELERRHEEGRRG
jgi:phosphopantothenate-cysteine ligase/phosphopantothenoylcysteine decarboxylase/phosphopantothenate--cysteine ligase